MASQKRPSAPSPQADGGGSPTASPPELIVMTSVESAIRARGATIASAAGADISPLADMLSSEGLTLQPLFGPSEERIQMRAAAVAVATPEAAAAVSDLTRFYRVEAPPDRLEEFAARLLQNEHVEAAYVKPGAEPAQINDMAPAPIEAPPSTPDFTARQGYLNAAPGGIDARFAWTVAGGAGAGVRIVDVEGAWRFTHEDLLASQGGVVGGTMSTDPAWRNHGTAVLGEFSGDRNAFGITGICPDANVRAYSIFGASSSSQAIKGAADLLGAGDIILIELHRPGPRFNFTSPQGQRGYIAVEWWPDDLAAIRYATAKGVIVVEAAGNGAENLDDPIYSTRPAGFPVSWANPFARSSVDSGAIVVGAGAPPSGNFGPDRSRLDFSNWGALIDAQGWGREVVTCGYGDLQGGSNEDLWYTAQFSGTSSASPIVVGACGCIQGALRGKGKPPLTPAQMRNILRTTGSPQVASGIAPLSQRIGNRPDLKAAIDKLTKSKEIAKEVVKEKDFTKDFKESFKEINDIKRSVKDTKETKETKEIRKEAVKEKDFTKDSSKEINDVKRSIKETKEIKEKEKEFKEKDKDIFEKLTDLQNIGVRVQTPEAAPSIEERVGALEQAVTQLAHFIGPELRPDLLTSALSGEADAAAAALSEQLQKQAVDAKAAKDAKDVEKTRDR